MMMLNLLAMGAPQEGQDPKAGMANMILMVAMMGVLFYFMLIRPQSKQRKEQDNLLKNIKSGDKVLMSNGIYGIIMSVKDKTFIVKIADNTKVEVLKSAVSTIVKGDDSAATT